MSGEKKWMIKFNKHNFNMLHVRQPHLKRIGIKN